MDNLGLEFDGGIECKRVNGVLRDRQVPQLKLLRLAEHEAKAAQDLQTLRHLCGVELPRLRLSEVRCLVAVQITHTNRLDEVPVGVEGAAVEERVRAPLRVADSEILNHLRIVWADMLKPMVQYKPARLVSK